MIKMITFTIKKKIMLIKNTEYTLVSNELPASYPLSESKCQYINIRKINKFENMETWKRKKIVKGIFFQRKLAFYR